MEIHIHAKPSDVHEISAREFNVLEINSIETKHSHWRQMSKGPTFALT